jgi:proline dehydrogenase
MSPALMSTRRWSPSKPWSLRVSPHPLTCGGQRLGDPLDAAFIQLARHLADLGAEHSLATHDLRLLRELLASRKRPAIEFLLGVRSDDAVRLARQAHDVRIYVPYGERWLRYFTRRVAESIGA